MAFNVIRQTTRNSGTVADRLADDADDALRAILDSLNANCFVADLGLNLVRIVGTGWVGMLNIVVGKGSNNI